LSAEYKLIRDGLPKMVMRRLLKRCEVLTKHIKSCYNDAMDGYKDIKRTSLYIPLELVDNPN